MKKKLELMKKAMAVFMLLAFVAVPFSSAPRASAAADVQITIVKFIDGVEATSATAHSDDFNVWETGFPTPQPLGAGNPTPYQLTASVASGSDYSVSEAIDSVTGHACSEGTPFALVGYTSGDTMADAAAGTPSTSPSFANLTTDKFVIIWNTDCGSSTQAALSAQDFAVANSSATGLKGYTVNLALTGATLSEVQSAVVKLSTASGTLLQTNTGTSQIAAQGNATTLQVPFDVSGTFNYATDGFWTNARESEFGETLAAGKIDATITLQNGQVITATDTNLSGDPTTIFPGSSNNSGPTVTVNAFVNGAMATATSANNASFQMSDSLGNFTLDGTTTSVYQYVTPALTSGASYSTSETLDSTVGATCSAATPFALAGYTSGDTLAEAEAATPSSSPSFTNLTADKFVIVWNTTCNNNGGSNNGGELPVPQSGNLTVTTTVFVNGSQATGTNASGAEFTMWNNGINGRQFTLRAATTPAYQYVTPGMAAGSEYAVSEARDAMIGDSCSEGKPFALTGYTWGDTISDALSATKTPSPHFMNLDHDKFVVVWNTDCANNNGNGSNGGTTGNIGGTVSGGTSNGTLAVDSVDTVNSNATADGTFVNGLKYTFNITMPENETHLAMKFGDWTIDGGAGTISAANNIRISSPQADNSGATVTVTAANTYTTPTLHMTTDLDPNKPGMQVQVTVEAAVPTGSVNGTYSTTYGVQTN